MPTEVSLTSRLTLVWNRRRQIEQWAEHHYPSFVSVAGSGGNVTSSIDASGNDARAVLYNTIAEAERRKAAVKKQQELYDSMVERGIIKPYKDSEGKTIRPDFAKEAAISANAQGKTDPMPYLFILGILAAILVVFGGLAALMIWIVTHFFVD